MSGSYPAARIKELLLDLICKLDPGHGHEHLHRAVHKYAAALQNHKYLSIIDKDVDKSFTGIREKLAITGRVKESMILSLSRDKFMERHAQARDKCIACDLTDGSGIPIPQCMLKLLLCLADTPTAIGKHVPIDELMDAERLLAQPVLPVFIEQGEPDKEEDVLTYTAWRDMCNVESSDDEADEAWLAEEVMDEPIGIYYYDYKSVFV